jgi:hypothetical protein
MACSGTALLFYVREGYVEHLFKNERNNKVLLSFPEDNHESIIVEVFLRLYILRHNFKEVVIFLYG